jgi:hypothetical protein
MATTKAKPKPEPTAAAQKHDPKALPVTMRRDQEITKVVADMAACGVVSNALLVQRFSEGALGKDQISLEGCIESLAATGKAAHDGDLKKAESLLVAQAATLNAIFCELARRAHANMGEYMTATETYLRLGLKAQAQCRATLETLAAIKNPPVVFARQANINHGGQQQVNNAGAPGATVPQGGALSPAAVPARAAPVLAAANEPATGAMLENNQAESNARARVPAEIPKTAQSELMERGRHG